MALPINIDNLKPNFFPVVEPVVFRKKHILIIWVPGGQNRPYQAPVSLGKKDNQHAYYIRRFSSTVKARAEDQKELIALAGTVPFDDRIHHSSEITDLKLTLIQAFLSEVGSDLYKQSAGMPFEQLCKQMMIIEGTSEYIRPRNVGLLFFNDLPQKLISLSQIEVVHFPETTGDDRLDEKIFQGPIHQQVRDVLTYLKNIILKEYVRKVPDQAEAIRYFNYPFVALEESIVNAMYHRGYDIREPVEIRIYPDRIEILSFPGPDRSIKQSDIKKGKLVARRYRNRRIGEFFKELKMTEGRCTGIPKIIRAMKANGSPMPIFETDEERTYFLTTLHIHPESQVSGKVAGPVTGPVRGPVELTDIQYKILLECSTNPLSAKEITGKIGLTSKSGNVKRAFAMLRKNEYLSYTIPEKPGSRLQKYRITKKGLKIINEARQ